MIIMNKIFVILAFLLVFNTGKACTTFIISGKNTPDGKPILYKNRDSGTLDNAMVYFTDGKYDYIGIVNSKENGKDEVWGGYNSEGFAIMNSAAYTNTIGDTTKLMDMEGVIMKKALQECKTVDDFEALLKKMPKPLGADANFGVIDAYGGAAYFETGNYSYKKVDANDPLVAPNGVLVRTNHSFNSNINEGYGYIRYATADKVLYQAAASGDFTPQFLLNNISRNLTHSLTGVDLKDNLPESKSIKEFKPFIDYIPRYSTCSVVLVKGVKPNENPKSTVMWTILGFPLTTVAVPVWLNSDKKLPKAVTMNDDFHSYMCDAGRELKKQCFPISRGSGTKYINLSAVINQEGDGILQKINEIETLVFDMAEEHIPENKTPDDKTITDFYNDLDHYLSVSYNKYFNLNLFSE
jgi:hypothetical protein